MQECGWQKSTRISFCFCLFPFTLLGVYCFAKFSVYGRVSFRFLGYHDSERQFEELGIRSLLRI